MLFPTSLEDASHSEFCKCKKIEFCPQPREFGRESQASDESTVPQTARLGPCETLNRGPSWAWILNPQEL